MIKRRFTLLASVGALAVAGLTACGSSDTTTTTSASSTAAATAAPPADGTAPAGRPPGGMGTIATGTAATKAGDAATAKYAGTVERVFELSDGSYVVHVITSSGEVHVKVSKAFAVTGTETGPPQGATPPSSTATPAGTTSS